MTELSNSIKELSYSIGELSNPIKELSDWLINERVLSLVEKLSN